MIMAFPEMLFIGLWRFAHCVNGDFWKWTAQRRWKSESLKAEKADTSIVIVCIEKLYHLICQKSSIFAILCAFLQFSASAAALQTYFSDTAAEFTNCSCLYNKKKRNRRGWRFRLCRYSMLILSKAQDTAAEKPGERSEWVGAKRATTNKSRLSIAMVSCFLQ